MAFKTADSKGRLTLGNEFANKTFIIKESKGKIVLTPAAVIPESEQWLLQDRRALRSVRAGLEDAKNRRFAARGPNCEADAAQPEE